MGEGKNLKLTQAQMDIIVDAIHRAYPNYDVNDVSMSLVNNGLTIDEAKELENGELVFSLCLRFKKVNDQK